MVSIDAGPHPGNQVAFDPSGKIFLDIGDIRDKGFSEAICLQC